MLHIKPYTIIIIIITRISPDCVASSSESADTAKEASALPPTLT